MADEQHQWLDADVAELLLRGEPVEAVGDHVRTEARRLEAALLALRAPRPSGDELPGEAAVLAAFREASRGAERAGRTGPAAQQDALHSVRIGAEPTAPRRRPRWTRPARYGLAVSLAGCALGGVAVAAGTGMLPAPFGGHESPLPAASVSAAASPERLEDDVPGTGAPSPSSSVPPGPPGSPAASDAPEAGTERSGAPTGQEGGGTAGPEDGDRETGTDGPRGGTEGREVPEGSPAEVYKKSVRACLAYRKDGLSQEDERRLLELADGEDNLDRFCDRLLDPEDRSGGTGTGTGGDGPGGGRENSGETGLDGEGSLPPVTFRTPAAVSTRDGARQSGAAPLPTAGPTASSASGLAPATR
ncbi:hypothetical protein [Streptomyces mutomycini]|uniref:Extensin n=1 Tax=Streptomyces mutomycini TaxID=284036 RepID=A0ABW0AXC8_9ACTN|nr:hypothetical protein [Streptomyces mutomycini]